MTADHNRHSRDEQTPATVGNNVPSRPDQLPPTCERLNSVKDKEQKGSCPLDVLRAPFDGSFVQLPGITSSSRSEACLSNCVVG